LFVYGKVIAGHIDPIEKKPVIHYMPGSKIFSIATTGCNWLCQYCQNYDISQRRKIEGVDMTPEEVVAQTMHYGCEGIAYTYNQPSIFIEFARDCGVIARKNGMFNVFVSNGYDTPETVSMMNEFLDCITVDFKGSAERKFTRRYIGVPDPQPIFDTLREMRDKTSIHIEITDLIVPQVGDDLESARKLCRFVYDELGPDTPVHFLRFHPDYKMMNLPQTPVTTLEKHYEIAKEEGIKYAYVGNVPGHRYEHTYCPECKNIVIGRFGYNITKWNLDKNNCCNSCGYPIPVIGKLGKSARENRFIYVV
jgi:pyruvate formate lyase activating enzyme